MPQYQYVLLKTKSYIIRMNTEDNIRWYHGKISREQAEETLRQVGSSFGNDGVFLVRESNTAPGDYVLSVLQKGEIVHYQIRRHGEDAFFSIDEQTPIHGLDALIEHYQQPSNGIHLTYSCKNEPPPSDTRRHGKNNLLHRATENGNLTVVTEMLKCGYRNIDAKNEYGQTAVHLACKNKNVSPDILTQLIERDANVNSRDTKGNTPLHYACQFHGPQMVQLLIDAKANLQSRNIENGWVPLHCAAKYGNLEVVKLLLRHNVPHMPRSSDGELPMHFAQESHHNEVAEYLRNYVPIVETFRDKWYHGTLGRIEAQRILQNYADELYKRLKSENAHVPVVDTTEENMYENQNKERDILTSGTFLVRTSERNNWSYVITMLFENQTKNYVIQKFGQYYYIDDGPYMISLEHLVQHYMRFADGIPINLKYNVMPEPKPPLPVPLPVYPQKTLPHRKSDTFKTPVKSPKTTRNLSIPNDMTALETSPKKSSPANSPKSSWISSLSLRRSKNKNKEKPVVEANQEIENIAELQNTLKKLKFTSPATPTQSPIPPSSIVRELYDSPPSNDINDNSLTAPSNSSSPQKCDDVENYFTEPDTKSQPSNLDISGNNLIEEIYFIDAPTISNDAINAFDVTEDGINNNNKRDTIYFEQNQLIQEIDKTTGKNYYVSRTDLLLQKELGKGEFGLVYQGLLVVPFTEKVDVAVKTLHESRCRQNRQEFLREASVMIKLQHPCIVKLIGICKGPPSLMIVQELMPLGSLLSYLQNNGDKIFSADLKLWASQIASGMQYLESQRFVHRDLASRNILLQSHGQVKISDFGLSRAVCADKDYYQAQQGGMWPLKWYAPESYNYGLFSHASDVWSFGVTLWEMFSMGATPYGDLKGEDAKNIIESGRRLNQPDLCPQEIYDIMLACWNYHARNRPTFKYLARFFSQPPEYENVTECIRSGLLPSTIET